MNPEEETEAAHFELWASELEPEFTVYLLESMPKPSPWVRVGEITVRLAVWFVIITVGLLPWAVLALIIYGVTR